MKMMVFGMVFLCFFLAPAGFSQSGDNGEARAELAPISYDRTTIPVGLKNASPAWIEESLVLLNRNWGTFPSLQYLRFPIPGGDRELLFLRGRTEEVDAARRVAEQLDNLYPVAAESQAVIPLPLSHLSAGSMRAKILAFSEQAGIGLAPAQLIIFPDKSGGSLFFQGTPSSVTQVREIKKELDQPRHESLLDLIFGFSRSFREDLSIHFLTVSTYVASALILLIIHFILIHIPGVGKFYQRWFTLIWTRLIDDVKGRNFAFEVIKSLAETAVEAVEQSGRNAMKNDGVAGIPLTGSTKKSRALAIARDLLIFRGFNPDDPQIKSIVNDVIESTVFRLNNPDKGRAIFDKTILGQDD